MKKLLSILAAVGMTATASTAVVACTASVSAKDAPTLKNGYVSISNKKIALLADLPASAAGTDLSANYTAFDNKGKAFAGLSNLKVTLAEATTKETKKNKEVKVNISFFLASSVSADKKVTIKLGSAKTTGKHAGELDKTAVKITVKTPTAWDNAYYDGTNVTFKTTVSMKKGANIAPTDVELKDADGKSVTPTLDFKEDTTNTDTTKTVGTLTVTFAAPARKKDSTQSLAYTLTYKGDKANNVSLVSTPITFTIPATGLPLAPSETPDNGGSAMNANDTKAAMKKDKLGAAQQKDDNKTIVISYKGEGDLSKADNATLLSGFSAPEAGSFTVSATSNTITVALNTAESKDTTVTAVASAWATDSAASWTITHKSVTPPPATTPSVTAGQTLSITDASKKSFDVNITNGKTATPTVTIKTSDNKTLAATAAESESKVTVTINDDISKGIKNGTYTVSFDGIEGTATLNINVAKPAVKGDVTLSDAKATSATTITLTMSKAVDDTSSITADDFDIEVTAAPEAFAKGIQLDATKATATVGVSGTTITLTITSDSLAKGETVKVAALKFKNGSTPLDVNMDAVNNPASFFVIPSAIVKEFAD